MPLQPIGVAPPGQPGQGHVTKERGLKATGRSGGLLPRASRAKAA